MLFYVHCVNQLLLSDNTTVISWGKKKEGGKKRKVNLKRLIGPRVEMMDHSLCRHCRVLYCYHNGNLTRPFDIAFH